MGKRIKLQFNIKITFGDEHGQVNVNGPSKIKDLAGPRGAINMMFNMKVFIFDLPTTKGEKNDDIMGCNTRSSVS